MIADDRTAHVGHMEAQVLIEGCDPISRWAVRVMIAHSHNSPLKGTIVTTADLAADLANFEVEAPYKRIEEMTGALKLATDRIVELEAEVKRLLDELNVRQSRVWAIQTACQLKASASDKAKFEYAVDLEAYLLGSRQHEVDAQLHPSPIQVASDPA